jgi:hypothetical protein
LSDLLLDLHRSLAHQGSAKILDISIPISFRDGFREPLCIKTSVEECSILLKAKEGENFNHPSTICRTYGAGKNKLSILRINPPKFGDGLKFEPDAEIGQKGAF